MLLFLRYLFLIFWIFFISVVALLFVPFIPFMKTRLHQIFGKLFSEFGFLVLGLKVNYVGMEKINQNAPCVIIANHQSTLDLMTMTAHFPSCIVYVSKRAIMYIPFFGQIFWLAGHLGIDRKNIVEAKNTLHQAQKLFEKKKCLLILPEGTRSWSKTMGPFKKGAFHMAYEAKVPILPIAVSSYDDLNFKKLHSGSITVEVLDPILPPKSIEKNELDSYITNARNVLMNHVEKIS